MEYIAILLLAIGPNDVLAMPFPDVGPRSLSECQSIGFSSYEYALSLDEDGDGFTTVVLPDGTKLQAEPVGWSCAPAEWYEGKGQE